MIRMLSGHAVKLASPEGVYLGVLMVPTQVARQLGDPNAYYVRVQGKRPLPGAISGIAIEAISSFDLCQSAHIDDAAVMHRMAPEEVSLLEGFAFLPGVA